MEKLLWPNRFSDLLMGETYDARSEMKGWDEPSFDDSGWHSVSAQEEIGNAQLAAEPSQPVRVTQEVAAKEIMQPREGVYVFDMGQNIVGRVRLKVRGEAGTEISLRYAEALNRDGTIYTENLRTARQTDTYILKGKGEEIFEPHFTFIRDIPNELYDSMVIEGATHFRLLRNLVLPLSRPALVTVIIYNALQVWNNFLFPLVLTQSSNIRVLLLAMREFQGQFGINVPGLMAAVFLSALPIFFLYVVAPRQLLGGLTAGFGK